MRSSPPHTSYPSRSDQARCTSSWRGTRMYVTVEPNVKKRFRRYGVGKYLAACFLEARFQADVANGSQMYMFLEHY